VEILEIMGWDGGRNGVLDTNDFEFVGLKGGAHGTFYYHGTSLTNRDPFRHAILVHTAGDGSCEACRKG